MIRKTEVTTPLRTAVSREFRIGRMFEDAARRHPGGTVVINRPLELTGSGQTEFSYAELADVVDDFAARFRQAGVRAGEHVAVYAAASFDLPLLACAASRAGAVPVMLSPALAPDVVMVLLGRLTAPWMVADPAGLARLTAADATLGDARVLLTRRDPDSQAAGTSFDLLSLAGARRIRPVDLPPGHQALITHSSGTTGVPKLMVHTARTLGFRLLPQQLIAWPVRGREPVLLAMSVVHSRFFNSLGVFLSYGNKVAIADDTSPDTIRAMLTAVRPGVVETHPNNFMQWEDFGADPSRPLSSVRYYSATFDALHPGTVKNLLAASRRRRPMLLQMYGQSETGPLSGWLSSRRGAEHGDGRRIGYPLPGFVRLRVVDAAGRRVPRGTIGRLQARTRGLTRTYLAEDARFHDQLDHGWWSVGDAGWQDRSGRFYLADREVDQIADVDSALALEDVLLERVPDVCEVVIMPNESGPPVPYVATRDDRPFDRARWAEVVADLPELETPVQWRFDDFPRTGTWKIRRLEMREMLGAGAAPEPVPAGAAR